MWFQDIQAKKDKEEREAKKVYDRNREITAILKDQMKVLEDQKFEENRLRVENARLLVSICKVLIEFFWLKIFTFTFFKQEKQNIEKLEKQFAFQKKREDQAKVRHELDQCVK